MSLTIQGLLAIMAAQVLEWSGAEFAKDELMVWAIVTMKLCGAVTVFIGRYRHGDINLLGRKR